MGRTSSFLMRFVPMWAPYADFKTHIQGVRAVFAHNRLRFKYTKPTCAIWGDALSLVYYSPGDVRWRAPSVSWSLFPHTFAAREVSLDLFLL